MILRSTFLDWDALLFTAMAWIFIPAHCIAFCHSTTEGTRLGHRGEGYDALKKRFQARLLDVLYKHYPQLKGKVSYVDCGTPLDNNFYLGKERGESYGLLATPDKVRAEVAWLGPQPNVPGFPKGLFLAGQDLVCDGFAPAVTSALIAAAAIEGPLHWLEVIRMVGGLDQAFRALGGGDGGEKGKDEKKKN